MSRPAASWKTVVAVTVLTAAFGVAQAFAQNLTGEIDGTVRDTSGAAVPGAKVIVKNTDKGLVERTVVSGSEGQFTAPLLEIGTYAVTVVQPGFEKTTVNDIVVHVNQPVSIPVTMSIGEVSQAITVQAATLSVQVETATAGTVIAGTQVRELSLANRNFEQLLSLQPGVSGSTSGRGIISPGGQTNPATFSVNGQQPNQNGYFLDGSDILNHGGSQQVGVFPSIDAIAEINLMRNSFGAEYGGEGSAIVTMASRSGDKQFHGGAFYFFRSQVLDANNYFNNLARIARPGLRYNDFGYNVGGPLWIPRISTRDNPKTFFFVAQEFLRSEAAVHESITNIPTAAQRQGIFTAPVCVQYTGSACTKSVTRISTVDPTAQGYLTDVINKTPLPNNPSDVQGLITNQPGTNNETQVFVRIDHKFNDRLSVFFRYLHDPFTLQTPFGLYQGTGIPGVGNEQVLSGGSNYLAHATFVLSSRTVLNGGYGYLSNYISGRPTGYLYGNNAPDIHPTLPYPVTTNSKPTLNVNGSNYRGSGNYDNPASNKQAFVNVISTLGAHTINYGGNFEDIITGNNQAVSNSGSFIFRPGALAPGSTSQFEQAFANFLLGTMATYTQSSVDPGQAALGRLYEAYVQDDYKATRRLTVNLGVRYTLNQQPISVPFENFKFKQMTNFDPATFNPAHAAAIDNKGQICTAAPCSGGAAPNPNYDPLNGVITAGTNSPFGQRVNSQPKLNFAPRVGFALDVFGNGRMALRGGFGIYYVQTRLGNYTQILQANPPFVANTSIANTSLDAPGNGVAALSAIPLSLSATNPRQVIPYTENYSLDTQSQLRHGLVLDIGYYGNHQVHQQGVEDLNQPAAGAYVANKIIAGNAVTAANSTLLNQIRPYPGWGPINYLDPRYSGNYNSLQVALTKQFRDGNLVNLDYTWAKSLTNSQNFQTAPQQTSNINAEYGPSPINRKHIFSANFVYVIPVFRDQKGLVGETLGGWETSGIISIQSGSYLTAETINVDPAGVGRLAGGVTGASERPDVVVNPNTNAPHTRLAWFNTKAFTQVPLGQYRPGNASVGDIFGPSSQTWDLSLFKNFALFESGQMQFRAEAFNVFNHTNFTAVSTTLGQTNYGQVTAAADPRTMQLALKLRF